MDDIKKMKLVATLLRVSVEDVPKVLKRFADDVKRAKGSAKA